jgi:anti-anti-sigma regulatory factor
MKTDELKNHDNDTPNEDKQSLIGVDPLAWLSDEEKDSVLNNKQRTQSELDADDEIQSGTTYTVNLNSALTIRDVSELMDELNQINNNHSEVIFESEQLEKVDTAALQLLLGFCLFATDAGKKVIWNKPSEAFCHAVELLGLNEILNLKASSA